MQRSTAVSFWWKRGDFSKVRRGPKEFRCNWSDFLEFNEWTEGISFQNLIKIALKSFCRYLLPKNSPQGCPPDQKSISQAPQNGFKSFWTKRTLQRTQDLPHRRPLPIYTSPLLIPHFSNEKIQLQNLKIFSGFDLKHKICLKTGRFAFVLFLQ